MKSTLPATHLLGHLLLFTLTLVFLSTMARSAHVLWQFFEIEQSGNLLSVFVSGLRHDLAAAGLVCLIPASLGFLLAMFSVSRGLAKALIVSVLLGALVLMLLLELLTPWFMQHQGVRPDLAAILGVSDPVLELVQSARTWPMPTAIGGILFFLILLAFLARLELNRMLRYRLASGSSLLLMSVCTVLCLLAIWSTTDVTQQPLAYRDTATVANNTTETAQTVDRGDALDDGVDSGEVPEAAEPIDAESGDDRQNAQSPEPTVSAERTRHELSLNSLGKFLFTALRPIHDELRARYWPAAQTG